MLSIMSILSGSILLACPPTIRDTQSVTRNDGWSVKIVEMERTLEYIEVYSGHPSKRGALKPTEENGSFVWYPGVEETWVQCRYRNSAAILFRSVGKVESCSFTKPVPGRGVPAKAECRLK